MQNVPENSEKLHCLGCISKHTMDALRREENNSKNTIWIVDPFTQVKSAEHMAKSNTKSISNWGTFCNFSLAPKRKIYKTSMKHLKIHKFPFKNVIVLAIECKMYLKIQKNFTTLVAFQNRPWITLRAEATFSR